MLLYFERIVIKIKIHYIAFLFAFPVQHHFPFSTSSHLTSPHMAASTDVVTARLNEIESIGNTLIERLTDSAEQLEECGEFSERIANLETSLIKVLSVIEHTRDYIALYSRCALEIRGGVSKERISELQGLLVDAAKQTIDLPSLERRPVILQFKERVWQVNHPTELFPGQNTKVSDDSGNDVIVATQKQSLICPLTQATFVNPVTNESCGHTYSHDAILAMARAERRVPCPIIGCDRHVVVSKLRPNEALQRLLHRKNAETRIF